MEITTLKVRKTTKMKLDSIRRINESYDLLLQRMAGEIKKKSLKKILIECYTKNRFRDKETNKEWELANSVWK